MLNYITIGDCPVSDFLHQNRIPHIYDINLASEALCKLPEILPHMAVYNVPREYQFTQEEFAMDLIPEYYYLKGDTSMPQEDGCVEDVDGMIWVSWYETVKEHELDRTWNVEETLLCNSNEGIKRPAVAVRPRSAFVANPSVPYNNQIAEEKHYAGSGVPEGTVNDLRWNVQDLYTRVSETQSKVEKFLRGLSGDWDVESKCEEVLSIEDEESKNSGSGGRKDMTTNKKLKLSPYNLFEAGKGLKLLPGEEGKGDKNDPNNSPCDIHIWLDIKKDGVLCIRNGAFDVIPLPAVRCTWKQIENGDCPTGWVVFNKSGTDITVYHTCGADIEDGMVNCESCKDKKK